MTSLRKLSAAVFLAAVATIGVGGTAQQTGRGTPPQTGQPPKVVNEQAISLIGCVERVVPPKPAPGATSAPTPAYKMTDVQPGNSVAQKPKVYAKEYFVVGPESIAFSKFQNQWVEITGTITQPTTGTPATGGDKPAAPPLSTVTVTAIKLVSTECK